ncbi:hypothetical protein Patl1_26202 [Pistacia atlantica]|uniref:Uncharacterized protein n=1 Tax=Pistacia atlantica TaxID=434234 RepID=A0ACC1B1A8_9ROSI|nr:hypothetical protein Patl1_26202 [Pistacia atlantica]
MDSLHLRTLNRPSTFLHHPKPLKFVHSNLLFFNPRISSPVHLHQSRKHFSGVVCGVSSTETREEEKKKMKMKSKSGSGNVRLNVRLDHQVEFGESVAILGSVKELGLWKKAVKMNWSESGWVCDLKLKGEESIEYKFVIVRKDKSMVWENGDNRILKLPVGGSFGIIYHWNETGEAVDLLPLSVQENEEDTRDVGEIKSTITVSAAEALLEVETSPFVGQWQGKAASFMRSNENWNRESDRKWDTSNLEGLALKLVENDQNARNWWRKVCFLYPVLPAFFIKN